jgi:hypothetical protein
LGGDYPAFHAAGEMVLAGDGDHLYDPSLQAEAQAPYYGEEDDGGYLPFAYPPAVALAYAPLAALPYAVAYVVQVALMVAALVAAVRLLGARLAPAGTAAVVVVAAALTFFPMFRSVTAGQNTAVALLLVVIAWRAIEADRPWLGGIALGLLAYKPQYAAVFLFVALVARRWKVLGGAAIGAAVIWVTSALVAGPQWVADWWTHAQRFAELDTDVDRANAVSWQGIVHVLVSQGTAADLLVAGLVACTLVALGWAARRADRQGDLAIAIAVAAPAALLVAPHALFYDAGLLLLSAGVIAGRLGRTGRRVVAAVWFVSLGHVAADAIGVTPVAAAVVATGFAALAAASLPPDPATGGEGRGSVMRCLGPGSATPRGTGPNAGSRSTRSTSSSG